MINRDAPLARLSICIWWIMTLYQDKYRVESARLKDWDYSTPWYYFVTICTKGKKCWFGEVVDSKVVLSKIGMIAKQCWDAIPEHFVHVELDEFVIMPNHVHGILIINCATNKCRDKAMGGEDRAGRDMPWHVSTEKEDSAQFAQPRSGSLSMVINQYKGSVTRQARRNDLMHFAWQPQFYDHIIRNEKSLEKIRHYIYYNVAKWEADEYYVG